MSATPIAEPTTAQPRVPTFSAAHRPTAPRPHSRGAYLPVGGAARTGRAGAGHDRALLQRVLVVLARQSARRAVAVSGARHPARADQHLPRLASARALRAQGRAGALA